MFLFPPPIAKKSKFLLENIFYNGYLFRNLFPSEVSVSLETKNCSFFGLIAFRCFPGSPFNFFRLNAWTAWDVKFILSKWSTGPMSWSNWYHFDMDSHYHPIPGTILSIFGSSTEWWFFFHDQSASNPHRETFLDPSIKISSVDGDTFRKFWDDSSHLFQD